MENDNKLIQNELQIYLDQERKLLEMHFPFFESVLLRNQLCIFGNICTEKNPQGYSFLLQVTISGPQVIILHPKIQYHPEIHMYPDSSLCLYDPRKGEWDPSNHVYSLIPWISEWLIFYELYLINGVWLHPEAEHFQPKQI